MSEIAGAFVEECEDLDALVARLPDDEWARPTPAPGWTIAHQIAHLAWTDEVALAAIRDPEAFTRIVVAATAGPGAFVDDAAASGAAAPRKELLDRWRTGRAALAAALDACSPTARIPWFGPAMGPRSMATARLMETWAHGQDVADALGAQRSPTERLRDICHLGIRTRDFAYRNHGVPLPAGEFRVELAGPGGHLWIWGPPDAADQVRGEAQDFALVVTQRRPWRDTGLRATGEAAPWLTFAQAFAGPPTTVTRDE